MAITIVVVIVHSSSIRGISHNSSRSSIISSNNGCNDGVGSDSGNGNGSSGCSQ